MNESPAFQKMKAEGTHSKAPLSEAFGQWRNAKWALLALFGLTAGQAVVWYPASSTRCSSSRASEGRPVHRHVLIAWSLLLATGGFLFFGALSDKVGRKPIILGGCLIAALTYFPLFEQLTANANPALYQAQSTVPVVVKTNPDDCSFQFNPVGTAKFTKECDVAKALLARSAVNYSTEPVAAGTPTIVTIAGKDFPWPTRPSPRRCRRR